MHDTPLTYLGTASEQPLSRRDKLFGLFGWLTWPLAVVVLLPTLVTAVYYLLIASPRYVSEASFIVRSAETAQPNSLGIVLQGVGLSPAQGDAFAVHEYMVSRDSIEQLRRRIDLPELLAKPGSDFLSRYPHAWETRSNEGLHKAFQRFLTVGYDSSSGISTIRVAAFDPRDAQLLNAALLEGGEGLINRLNQRASADSVADAERTVIDAESRLAAAQSRLTRYRNQEGFIDPTISAREGAEIVNGLGTRLATLRAERAQMAEEAPASPQLSILDGQIRAYEAQIRAERARIAGGETSLAPKIGAYEALELDRELANTSVVAARTALDAAREDIRRQRLYLERVVNPSLPDRPSEPQRWRSIFLVFITTLLIYGLGWLVLAGVREHRQD